MSEQAAPEPSFEYHPFQSTAAFWLHIISGLLCIGVAFVTVTMFAEGRFDFQVIMIWGVAIILQCLARLWERVIRLTRQVMELEQRLNHGALPPR